jgi:hypothetical protein
MSYNKLRKPKPHTILGIRVKGRVYPRLVIAQSELTRAGFRIGDKVAVSLNQKTHVMQIQLYTKDVREFRKARKMKTLVEETEYNELKQSQEYLNELLEEVNNLRLTLNLPRGTDAKEIITKAYEQKLTSNSPDVPTIPLTKSLESNSIKSEYRGPGDTTVLVHTPIGDKFGICEVLESHIMK